MSDFGSTYSDEYFPDELRAAAEEICAAAAEHNDILHKYYHLSFAYAYETYLTPFAQPGTTQVTVLKSQLAESLEPLREAGSSDPGYLSNITDLTLTSWRSPAGDEFAMWVVQLRDSIDDLCEFVEAMTAWLDLQTALVESVRAALLAICQQTAAALKGAAAADAAADRNILAAAVGTAWQAITGFVTAGPAGAIAGTLSGLGDILGAVITSVGGEDPDEIYASMLAAVSDLGQKAVQEQSALFDVLDGIVGVVRDDPESVLPPAVRVATVHTPEGSKGRVPALR